jgi:hypothetical protein
MGLREVAIVAEAVAALIGAVTTNHIPATVTVSSLPTVPRIPHPTPVLLPSQAMPNLRSILGTRSTASTMRRKAHRTPPYLSTTTTRIMPLSCININLHTELNLPTKQPLSRPTVSHIRPRRRRPVRQPSSGVRLLNPLRVTEHTVEEDAEDAVVTMNGADTRGS